MVVLKKDLLLYGGIYMDHRDCLLARLALLYKLLEFPVIKQRGNQNNETGTSIVYQRPGSGGQHFHER